MDSFLKWENTTYRPVLLLRRLNFNFLVVSCASTSSPGSCAILWPARWRLCISNALLSHWDSFMLTFFSQSPQLMSVQLLAASRVFQMPLSGVQACFSTRICVWFSTRICVWLHFSSFRATSLSSLSIVVMSFRTQQFSSLKTELSVISVIKNPYCTWRWTSTCRHTSVVASQLSSKNHIIRQKVYNCVLSFASRHQCTVIAPSKHFDNTMGWLDLLCTWEISQYYDIIHKMSTLCSSFSAP